MMLRPLLLAALLLPAAPVLAQSVAETHREHWLPSGKLPQRILVPLARDDCRTVARHHQAGKGQMLPAAADPRCVTQTALTDPAPAQTDQIARD